jgi:hypothetical protein
VVSVEDCKSQINHSVAIKTESLQTSAETAVNGSTSDSNNKKTRQPISGQNIDQSINNSDACVRVNTCQSINKSLLCLIIETIFCFNYQYIKC